jgi:hypothetical protein
MVASQSATHQVFMRFHDWLQNVETEYNTDVIVIMDTYVYDI